MRIVLMFLTGALCGLPATTTCAQQSLVTGGTTSILLDAMALDMAAGLELSSVSDEVTSPGALDADSVGLPIRARDAAPPAHRTTLAYDPMELLATVSGTVEHAGSLFFNMDAVEVGDFSMRFQLARMAGAASGFTIWSRVGLSMILFDVGTPTVLEPMSDGLTIEADLLISPEFAAFLMGAGLASMDLTGVDVGEVLLEAVAETSNTLEGAILQALADLEALDSSRHVDKAIDRLERALDHLDADGEPTKKVFHELHRAAKELRHESMLRDIASDLTDAVRAAVVAAIDEAVDEGGKAKEIRKAERDLRKADRDAARHRFDKAIKFYGKVFERSQRSVHQHHGGGGNGNGNGNHGHHDH